MGDARVSAFLAQKIGLNLRLLGKTIVFVPNIQAANSLAGLLYDQFPDHRGKVATVQSKMEELQVPGQASASVHEVLDRFRRLGDQPSVLVNVDMLTEGFDDPKVRTVVLARLTLSTNRFWQMIGRGTRGPATRPSGTPDCNVIDPVKLTRLYDYFAGYQPSFSSESDVEFEDLEEKGGGEDGTSPTVPYVHDPRTRAPARTRSTRSSRGFTARLLLPCGISFKARQSRRRRRSTSRSGRRSRSRMGMPSFVPRTVSSMR
jgi:hypothetical protein